MVEAALGELGPVETEHLDRCPTARVVVDGEGDLLAEALRRRSIVVSESVRLIDASLALFARFGGNDKLQDLVSMLD